ncbi:hypothetical protein K0M31_000599, partial [Melipona bicolor]
AEYTRQKKKKETYKESLSCEPWSNVERRTSNVTDNEERRVENNIAARPGDGDGGGTKAECHEFRLAWRWYRRVWSLTIGEHGPVCSDKGESPDIGQTVECPHVRIGQQDFSLYLLPVSSALWTEVAG